MSGLGGGEGDGECRGGVGRGGGWGVWWGWEGWGWGGLCWGWRGVGAQDVVVGGGRLGKKHKIWGLQAGRCSLCSVPSSNASRGDPHVQFALGSVLKLMGSAFGGLGSFRVPSIRRALPVLLGGLLCAVGSSALAQAAITDVAIEATPATQTYSTASGGTTPLHHVDFTYDCGGPVRPANRLEGKRGAELGRKWARRPNRTAAAWTTEN